MFGFLCFVARECVRAVAFCISAIGQILCVGFDFDLGNNYTKSVELFRGFNDLLNFKGFCWFRNAQ